MPIDWNGPTWKRIRGIATAIGAFLAAVGYIELPAQFKQWGAFFKAIAAVLDHDVVRTLLVTVGIVVVIAVNVLPYLKRRQPVPVDAPMSSTSPMQIAPVPPPQSVQPSTALVQQEERPTASRVYVRPND